ncbi:ATP-binding cassette domain-containing protein [Shimia abyssi]|uniref:Sulfate-transporting ATPase n=1 Tax=Shimia abyssi TaxID=1662395 RepID=A0A2P8FFR7_9RHOB|nr:ATP-binding cassette domain-containing protein [Shimia abyssi]PSL20538.1 sulfate-transporting ATPase [Shimia abyssi]
MANDHIVKIRGLKHSYKEASTMKQVLHGIDVDVHPGQNVFLTGYSGSGKTTLISLVGCLRSVQDGSLKLFDEELNKASARKLLAMRKRVGYVFQHFNLLDFLSIRQNVQQSLEIQPDYNPREARKLSEEMLDAVGLGDRVNDHPSDLSGGQKQRVAIARALVHRPKLLIADEPTAALDTSTGRDIIDLVQRLSRAQNSAAIIVTHNMRILDSADEILHMIDGRIGTAITEQISLVLPNLDDRHLAEIASKAIAREYKPGDLIIKQGDPADEFYILTGGEAHVFRLDDNGNRTELATFSKRGTYFGEMGLLTEHGTRTACVEVHGSQPTRLLAIKGSDFAEMIGRSRATRAVITDEMWSRFNTDGTTPLKRPSHHPVRDE